MIFHRQSSSKRRAGFTLLEVLVAASIFSIIGVLATTIFVNVSRDRQRITSRNLLYDDAQYILDYLSRQITTNTIDYEEYYNQLVIGGAPGMNHGQYATSFYKRNDGSVLSCADLGDPDAKKLCVNVGKNETNENAFYSSGKGGGAKGVFCGDSAIFPSFLGEPFKPTFTLTKSFACVHRLFLIDASGKQKTMIAPERIDWSSLYKTPLADKAHVLSQAVMVNATSADKQTTYRGIFTCQSGSVCDGATTAKGMNGVTGKLGIQYPQGKDLETVADETNGQQSDQGIIARAYQKDFIPFTPSRVNIKNISFYISPVEDPHKAFGESNASAGAQTNIHQPKVTIILEVEPISNVKYGTGFPSISVQTSVTPGVFSEVQSYPPQMEKQL